MFVGAFYKTWAFYKNGLASLDLLFGKDIQVVLYLWRQDRNKCIPIDLPMLNLSLLQQALTTYIEIFKERWGRVSPTKLQTFR